VRKELVPAFGGHKPEQLRHDHVRRFIAGMEADGRGVAPIRRIHGVLSTALSDAVKRRRLTHNVAQHAALPAENRAERQPWSATQAVRFLDHARADRLGDLYEVLAGCGLRRGEVLALRWQDVRLDTRALVVRRTLSEVNGHLIFTTPKTKGSAAGVGLSSRVVAALQRQRARQDGDRAHWGEAYADQDLVSRGRTAPRSARSTSRSASSSWPRKPDCPGCGCTTSGTSPRP
jgi:integrase